MTLKLDSPITEWQENRPDNKPNIISPFHSSGPVWFVVKLTKEHVYGIYNSVDDEWIRSGDENYYSDDEVGRFIELPVVISSNNRSKNDT